MTVFEALVLMIAFGTLMVALATMVITSQKK